jgi:hypothetical protein
VYRSNTKKYTPAQNSAERRRQEENAEDDEAGRLIVFALNTERAITDVVARFFVQKTMKEKITRSRSCYFEKNRKITGSLSS